MLNEYVVIDMEMTGLSARKDKILEIGAVRIKDGTVEDEYQTLVNPNVEIRERITDITGISTDMVQDKPLVGEILQDFFQFIGESVLIGHSLIYDYSFMMQAAYDNKMYDMFKRKWYGIDTLKITKKNVPEGEEKTLSALCTKYGISDEGHHRALNDVYMTNRLYVKLCEEFEKDGKVFVAEEYVYKPKKDREPTQKEIQNVERLIKNLKIKPEVDIYKMSQSELSRYANYIRFNQYTLAGKQ